MVRTIVIEGEAMDLKLKELRQIQVDGINWFIYYLDETKNEKWVKEYPNSQLQGGGEPQLRFIKKFPWE